MLNAGARLRHRLAAVVLLAATAAPAAASDHRVSTADIRWADDLVIKGQRTCDTGTLPLSVLREAYLARERLWQCTDAVLGLPGDARDAPQSEADAAAFDAYRTHCLVSFASITDPDGGYLGNRSTAKHLIQMTSQPQIDVLKHSVGTLSIPGDEDYCSGTLVDFGDGATTLVTALHCIGDLVAKGPGEAVLKSVTRKMTFRTIAGDDIIVRLGDEVAGREISYPDEDVVGLKLPHRPGAGVPATAVTPELFEPLLIVGASPYLFGKLTGAPRPAELADIIAVALEPYCINLGQSPEGRLYYNCQTDRSQSGSAIITVRSAAFVFNGVHTRGSPTPEQPCPGQVGLHNSGLAIGIDAIGE